jgi:hypothetical protein
VIKEFISTCVYFGNVNEIQLFEPPHLTPLYFCLRGFMKSEVDKIKTNRGDEFLVSILDSAAQIKKRDDKLRRSTRHIRTRVAECIDVNDEIFVHLL